MEIRLTRPGSVRGRVTDAGGRPVAKREVRASAADGLENRYYDPTVATADDGTYELKFIRPGDHLIQVAPFWGDARQAPGEPVVSWTSRLVSQRTVWTSGFRIEGGPHRVDPDSELPAVKPSETLDLGDLLIEKREKSSRRRPRSAISTESCCPFGISARNRDTMVERDAVTGVGSKLPAGRGSLRPWHLWHLGRLSGRSNCSSRAAWSPACPIVNCWTDSTKSAAGGPTTIRLEPCATSTARLVDAHGGPIAGYHDANMISMIIAPSPDPAGRDPAAAAGLSGQVGRLFAIDPINYAKEPTSDAVGRITFPALIPGATYRIGVRARNAGQFRKDFTVKPGETLDLGDILIGSPMAR